MSDFDNFESAAPGEEDPAAEFLAREQDQLAELEDDGFMAGQTQGSSDFGMPDSSGADMFDPMGTEGDNVEATPDDQFAKDKKGITNDAGHDDEEDKKEHPDKSVGKASADEATEAPGKSEEHAEAVAAAPEPTSEPPEGDAKPKIEAAASEATSEPPTGSAEATSPAAASETAELAAESESAKSAAADVAAPEAAGDSAMAVNDGEASGDLFGSENADMELASVPEPNYQLSADDIGAQDAGFDPFAGGMSDDMTEDPYADPAAHDYQYAAQPITGESGGDAYSGYSAISHADKQRQEPEKIRLWREEQKTMLEEKDIESDKRKAEWREVAKKELEEWYKHRAEQFEKTKVNNREHETSLIEERDESIPGHEWERVCRLCEFNPKNSGNKKDVSRQRSILLQLKQSPLVR